VAKHKYIETPEKMWELFLDYAKDISSNPIEVVDYVGAKATEVTRKHKRCLTMVGFENYVANQDLNERLDHYFCNLDDRYEAYVAICSRIKRSIRQDQIEGGMAGIYNASITQRLNGLTDKQDIEVKGQISPFTPIDLDVQEDNGTS
tara:strand:- start:920 stop:1360 length:441 start_codon:yes stop_codon:yes gene_type:complete